MLDLWRAAPRIVFYVIHPALCSLPGVVREAPVRILFGGEFADEVCGSGYTVPDLWAQTPLLRLVTAFQRLPRGPRDVLAWGKQRLRTALGRPALPWPQELPAFFHPTVREEYQAWYARQQREARDDAAPWRYLGRIIARAEWKV